jgi:hypothetical protein
MWIDQVSDLAVKYPDTNFLLIDINGHGRTIAGRKQYTLYDQCDDIVALMVALPYMEWLIEGRIVHFFGSICWNVGGLIDCFPHSPLSSIVC